MQVGRLGSLEDTVCAQTMPFHSLAATGFHGPVSRNVGHEARGAWELLRFLGLHMSLSTPLSCRFYSKDSEGSWFRSLFVHKVDPRKDAHSTLLSKKETSNLYKIQCE